MLPDQVSNPGPLTNESGALPIALRGPAIFMRIRKKDTLEPVKKYLTGFCLFVIHLSETTPTINRFTSLY